MNLPKITRVLAGLVVMALFLSACDSEEAELTTTSTLVTEAPAPADSTTTTVAPSEATTSTTVGSSVASFDVVAREAGDAGDIVYIVIPQAAYTDVDMENFVGDLLEDGIATWGAEIFDDIVALEAYQKDESDRTEEEVELIDQHHFVSLVNGDTIRFQGPFEASGEILIGS
ncbi:MAG: hypothetical protein O6951_08650 [Actinobacteria bacterium]|nr:hypothetical protein [Actinomycetota bacterium]